MRKRADGKLSWRLLPLQAAIILHALEKTISALLGAFSKGVACKDDQEMLPLHLAFRNGNDKDKVNLLLISWRKVVPPKHRRAFHAGTLKKDFNKIFAPWERFTPRKTKNLFQGLKISIVW